MIASLVFTCTKHAKLAAATSALEQRIAKKFFAMEKKDAGMEVPADVEVILCDFPFGANLNGGAFLLGYAGILEHIFGQGFKAVKKRDSDAVLVDLAIQNEPLLADLAHVRGVRIGGCLSGGCYVLNEHVPAAIRAFVEKYRVPAAPIEPDLATPGKTRRTSYDYSGPILGNRWTPTAEDLCTHRAVADVGGLVELGEHYWKPLRHPADGLPKWAPVALLAPLLEERIPALCEHVKGLVH